MEQLKREIICVVKQDDGALFAYVFGSRVKDTPHAHSDVGVTVYFNGIEDRATGDVKVVEK